VIPVALQIHFFSKNKNAIGYMQKSNRTLLIESDYIILSEKKGIKNETRLKFRFIDKILVLSNEKYEDNRVYLEKVSGF
jgi:hypothetical protein